MRRWTQFTGQSATRSVHRLSSRRLHDVQSLRERDASINAFVTFDESHLEDDAARRKDSFPSVLGSIAVKDNICTVSLPTTCSSAMLADFTSPFDATVVRILKEAGARLVGKTNCDEFGMGSFNIHSVHGPVINPHQRLSSTVSWVLREARSAGGSSGGSAAAVAAGLCDAALSTDTGGSTRLPAAYCGIVGLKPSYGIISRWGVVSFADSLDCVGIMSKTVQGVRSVFGLLAIHDSRDSTAASEEVRHQADGICQQRMKAWNFGSDKGFSNLQGLRVGVPQEYFPQELDKSSITPLKKILRRMRSLGASIVPVSLPSTQYALSAYYVLASAEASSNLARYSGVHYGTRLDPPADVDKTNVANVYAHTRTQCFGDEVKKRILLGTYALTADAFDNYFLQAQRVRRYVRNDFNAVFRSPNVLRDGHSAPESGVDVLLHPSAIQTAPLLSTDKLTSGLEAYVQDVLTVPASLAGLPAVSVPAGLADDEWPVGVTVVGQWGHDNMVLKVGEVIENMATLE